MGKKSHKAIELPLSGQLSQKDREIIDRVFGAFPSEQIYHDYGRDCLILYLRSLNLNEFKDTIEKTIPVNNGYAPNASEVLRAAVSSIENIRSYGIKGKMRVYVDYNIERKVKGRKAKEKDRSQYYYADDNDFSESNNEVPPEFIDRIVCADSFEYLKKLPDNCIDLIFTSPPYNFGLDYESNDDAGHWPKYFEQLNNILGECVRVLKYGGRLAVNIQPLFSDYIPSHHIISNYLMRKKMIWKGEILWEKNNYNCKYTAWGSWKSPSNPYLKYTWEFVEVFCKGTLKKTGDSSDADITADEFKQWVTAKWDIGAEKNMKTFDHPAMFPEELARRVLKLFSFRNDVILDPFNGVGTTTLVAKKLARRYIGVDISERYCETARKRLDEIVFK